MRRSWLEVRRTRSSRNTSKTTIFSALNATSLVGGHWEHQANIFLGLNAPSSSPLPSLRSGTPSLGTPGAGSAEGAATALIVSVALSLVQRLSGFACSRPVNGMQGLGCQPFVVVRLKRGVAVFCAAFFFVFSACVGGVLPVGGGLD